MFIYKIHSYKYTFNVFFLLFMDAEKHNCLSAMWPH
jgi:hypothetical protein